MESRSVYDMLAHEEEERSARYYGILSSGCASVDALLHGGFYSRFVTEICGVAGSGKTQLCLQLLLRAQLSHEEGGLHGTSCYMYSDSLSPLKRLQELSKHMPSTELSNVFLEPATDPAQFLHTLVWHFPD